MSQLTSEERNRISEIFVDCGMPQRHRQEIRNIIDRLSARCEELERLEKELNEERLLLIKDLSDRTRKLGTAEHNLSSLLSAVEPYLSSYTDESGETVFKLISNPKIDWDEHQTNLRTLSTIAAGIRGK